MTVDMIRHQHREDSQQQQHQQQQSAHQQTQEAVYSQDSTQVSFAAASQPPACRLVANKQRLECCLKIFVSCIYIVASFLYYQILNKTRMTTSIISEALLPFVA